MKNGIASSGILSSAEKVLDAAFKSGKPAYKKDAIAPEPKLNAIGTRNIIASPKNVAKNINNTSTYFSPSFQILSGIINPDTP